MERENTSFNLIRSQLHYDFVVSVGKELSHVMSYYITKLEMK